MIRGTISSYSVLIQFLAAFVTIVVLGWTGRDDVAAILFMGSSISLTLPLAMLAILYVVWMTNLYNFMDGIDGIIGFQSIVISVGSALVAYFAISNQEAVYGFSIVQIVLACAMGILSGDMAEWRNFYGGCRQRWCGILLCVCLIGGKLADGP